MNKIPTETRRPYHQIRYIESVLGCDFFDTKGREEAITPDMYIQIQMALYSGLE
jgi:hypothetical protein